MTDFWKKRIGEIAYGSTPICLPKQASLLEVVEVLNTHDIGCVIILEEGKAAGILTERDLIRKAFKQNIDLERSVAGDYMTPAAVSYTRDTLVLTTLIRMRLGKFRHVAINDADGRVIGVLSIKDIVAYILDANGSS